MDEVKQLKIFGRTNEEINPLVLFWTGSGFEANIRAGELWMEVEVDYDLYE